MIEVSVDEAESVDVAIAEMLAQVPPGVAAEVDPWKIIRRIEAVRKSSMAAQRIFLRYDPMGLKTKAPSARQRINVVTKR